MSVSKDERRAARRAWVERDVEWTICAIRIGGRVWVKRVSDAGALERKLGFMLRTGARSGLAPGMAEADDGSGTVRVEVVETLDPKLSEMARETLAKERLAHWAGVLGAEMA
ncbi:hypothetical protein [Maritimibacter sp. UBA3975]|uniref:hypothetical protein n=1 Tax=Maritimibacter sp. UBA3975 TaxID=1946833 RepID=UPI000C09D178|nr:hypothetical protein [Maritimibacter sp. UBA3975]MAM60295.1 hypothetical protein [Maritimibacter sp.]|tara:strand:- start:44385 stop:44720 length:336 start_codon:yes stop_codon:yes gene_type:complete